GFDHGCGYRREKRHSAAGCKSEIPGCGNAEGRSHDPRGPPPSSSNRDDGHGRGCRDVAVGAAIGAGSQMLQPLAIAVIGGILVSMVLSLIITPAIQYYLTRE